MLNTVVVHILCCVRFVVVCSLLGAYVWFVCSIQFVHLTRFVAVHLGKLSKVNNCYAINPPTTSVPNLEHIFQ